MKRSTEYDKSLIEVVKPATIDEVNELKTDVKAFINSNNNEFKPKRFRNTAINNLLEKFKDYIEQKAKIFLRKRSESKDLNYAKEHYPKGTEFEAFTFKSVFTVIGNHRFKRSDAGDYIIVEVQSRNGTTFTSCIKDKDVWAKIISTPDSKNAGYIK